MKLETRNLLLPDVLALAIVGLVLVWLLCSLATFAKPAEAFTALVGGLGFSLLLATFWLQRRQAADAVRPYIRAVWSESDEGDTRTLELQNVGRGPAVVHRLDVKCADRNYGSVVIHDFFDSSRATWQKCLDVCNELDHGHEAVPHQFDDGSRTIGPDGDKLRLVSFHFKRLQGPGRFGILLRCIEVRVHYTSLDGAAYSTVVPYDRAAKWARDRQTRRPADEPAGQNRQSD